MAKLNFNAAEVEPNAGFEPLPPGRYQAVINDSEMRSTRAGTGNYLWLEFEIVAGDHKGRKLWSNLNIENPNPEAVRIARADLSAICRAVNVLAPTDSVELHNLPLSIFVRCRKMPDGDIANDIRGYGPKEVAAPAAAAPAVSTPNAAPPWAKKGL